MLDHAHTFWLRLPYVGMTRARDFVIMTTSCENRFSRELMETTGR